jgi:protein-tyrosine phosphatase
VASSRASEFDLRFDEGVVTDILVVCTANLCRSPMVEAILRRRLEERGVHVTVASAGLLEPDRAAVDGARQALLAHGLDIAEHRSRRLDGDLVQGAGLVIGLERQHVREAVVLDRGIWPRAFTLKEIVRRAEAADPRRPDEPWSHWLARLHGGRQLADLLGASDEDDVADPMGGAPDDYEATAAEVDDLVTRLVREGWPAGVV